MATGTVSRTGMGIARGSMGTNTGDGTALAVATGFRPKTVTIFNITDATKWEKVDGMVDSTTFKTVTGGVMTADTTSAIVFTANGFITSAALNAAGKALAWFAA